MTRTFIPGSQNRPIPTIIDFTEIATNSNNKSIEVTVRMDGVQDLSVTNSQEKYLAGDMTSSNKSANAKTALFDAISNAYGENIAAKIFSGNCTDNGGPFASLYSAEPLTVEMVSNIIEFAQQSLNFQSESDPQSNDSGIADDIHLKGNYRDGFHTSGGSRVNIQQQPNALIPHSGGNSPVLVRHARIEDISALLPTVLNGTNEEITQAKHLLKYALNALIRNKDLVVDKYVTAANIRKLKTIPDKLLVELLVDKAKIKRTGEKAYEIRTEAIFGLLKELYEYAEGPSKSDWDSLYYQGDASNNAADDDTIVHNGVRVGNAANDTIVDDVDTNETIMPMTPSVGFLGTYPTVKHISNSIDTVSIPQEFKILDPSDSEYNLNDEIVSTPDLPAPINYNNHSNPIRPKKEFSLPESLSNVFNDDPDERTQFETAVRDARRFAQKSIEDLVSNAKSDQSDTEKNALVATCRAITASISDKNIAKLASINEVKLLQVLVAVPGSPQQRAVGILEILKELDAQSDN